MHSIPPAMTEHRCSCGAQRNKSSKRCCKCSDRGRWHRRKAWRNHKTTIRYRTGKK